MTEFIIATKNKGKRNEFQQLFGPYGINVKSLLDLDEDIPDVEETGITFKENAFLKAETIANLLHKPVLADDSGLMVDALDGRPGVYSARFAGEPKSDQRNNEKLLTLLKDQNNRKAKFVCVLACVLPNKETFYAEGTCEGTIALAPKGDNGFGYDPLFIPKGFKETMAQLGAAKKNQISHRYHALIQLEELMKHKGLLGDKK